MFGNVNFNWAVTVEEILEILFPSGINGLIVLQQFLTVLWAQRVLATIAWAIDSLGSTEKAPGITGVCQSLDFKNPFCPPRVFFSSLTRLWTSALALEWASLLALQVTSFCQAQKAFLFLEMSCSISVSFSSNQSWCFLDLYPRMVLQVSRMLDFNRLQCPLMSSGYSCWRLSLREAWSCCWVAVSSRLSRVSFFGSAFF